MWDLWNFNLKEIYPNSVNHKGVHRKDISKLAYSKEFSSNLLLKISIKGVRFKPTLRIVPKRETSDDRQLRSCLSSQFVINLFYRKVLPSTNILIFIFFITAATIISKMVPLWIFIYTRDSNNQKGILFSS